MFWFFLLWLIAIVGVAGIRVVRQQTAQIVETFGRFSKVLTPGLNWIIPGVQRIVATLDLRVQEIKAEVEVKTSDNVFVALPVAIMVKVQEGSADDAYYKLSSPKEQVKTWVLNTLRSATSGMQLAELFEDRAKLEGAVKDSLSKRMGEFGYAIVGVLVDQPSVSDDVQASFNRVVSSQREKEAAEQEAQATRIRIVGEARAEAESQRLRALGLSDARSILSESLADAAMRAKSAGVDESVLLDLLLETNRLETIKQASEKGQMVLMDVRSAPNVSIATKNGA